MNRITAAYAREIKKERSTNLRQQELRDELAVVFSNAPYGALVTFTWPNGYTGKYLKTPNHRGFRKWRLVGDGKYRRLLGDSELAEHVFFWELASKCFIAYPTGTEVPLD